MATTIIVTKPSEPRRLSSEHFARLSMADPAPLVPDFEGDEINALVEMLTGRHPNLMLENDHA